jgi:hypothetical protein
MTTEMTYSDSIVTHKTLARQRLDKYVPEVTLPTI